MWCSILHRWGFGECPSIASWGRTGRTDVVSSSWMWGTMWWATTRGPMERIRHEYIFHICSLMAVMVDCQEVVPTVVLVTPWLKDWTTSRKQYDWIFQVIPHSPMPMFTTLYFVHAVIMCVGAGWRKHTSPALPRANGMMAVGHFKESIYLLGGLSTNFTQRQLIEFDISKHKFIDHGQFALPLDQWCIRSGPLLHSV